MRTSLLLTALLFVQLHQGFGVNITGTAITEELSNPADDDCISFTRLLGRIKAEFAFQKHINISDVDCQDRCIALKNCRSFSYGITGGGSSECMLSASTPKTQPAIFNDNGMIQNFVYYEKSREGCMELAFECGPDKIIVQGKSSEPFSGLVYPESVYNKTCQMDLNKQQTFSYEIPLHGVCGTRYTGNGLYENIVIIQWDDLIVTRKDRRFKINCQYDLSDLEISHKAVEVGQVTPLEMNLKVPRPEAVIRLINMESNGVNVARVGDNMIFRLELTKESPYGIFARNCKAVGENQEETLELIDAKGCPIHPEVFPQLQKNGSALETQFLAFRFRKSFQVFYQCTIDYCVDSCVPVECSGLKSFGKRKRSAPVQASVPKHVESSTQIKNALRIIDDIAPESLKTITVSKKQGLPLMYYETRSNCDTSYQLIAVILAIVSGTFFVMVVALVFYLFCHQRRNRQQGPSTVSASKEFIYPNQVFVRH